MPSITITSEQAAALARGENITVEAPARELHNVIVHVPSVAGSPERTAYVYDGELRPNGDIYATRWQRLTDLNGRFAQRPARQVDRPLRVVSARRNPRIIQVGA